jgi:hypothetical protein
MHEPPSNRTTWQYSLRGLLIVTAVVSIVLAIGIHFAGVMLVVGVMALIQVATLLASDWLIRAQNRRALAAVSSGSWIILGSGLVVISGQQMYGLIGTNGSVEARVFAACLLAAGAYCCYIARKRWRRLTGPLPYKS